MINRLNQIQRDAQLLVIRLDMWDADNEAFEAKFGGRPPNIDTLDTIQWIMWPGATLEENSRRFNLAFSLADSNGWLDYDVITTKSRGRHYNSKRYTRIELTSSGLVAATLSNSQFYRLVNSKELSWRAAVMTAITMGIAAALATISVPFIEKLLEENKVPTECPNVSIFKIMIG